MSGNYKLNLDLTGGTSGGKIFGPWFRTEMASIDELVGAEIVVPANTVVDVQGTGTSQIRAIDTVKLFYLETPSKLHFDFAGNNPTATSPDCTGALLITTANIKYVRVFNPATTDVTAFFVLGGS